MNDADLQHDRTGNAQNLAQTKLAPKHLTQDEFTDLLLEPAPAAIAAHLEACAECAQEAQRFASAIGAFEQQSRLWAERRASARPTPPYTRQTSASWLQRPAAWAAAAAALLLAAGIGVSSRHAGQLAGGQFAGGQFAGGQFAGGQGPDKVQIADNSSHSAQVLGVPAHTAQAAEPDAAVEIARVSPDEALPMHAASAPEPTPATLKADNDLLSAIDGELSSDASLSASAYGLEAGSNGTQAQPHSRVSN